ncbi:hypothetical protein HDU99_007086, partial [Rhizoclosmatium hyalinum]
ALMSPLTKFAKTVIRSEGTGSATMPQPPYYNKITAILGNLSSVKGSYSSRNSKTSGCINSALKFLLEPKSDTLMTAYAKDYDKDAAKYRMGDSGASSLAGM